MAAAVAAAEDMEDMEDMEGVEGEATAGVEVGAEGALLLPPSPAAPLPHLNSPPTRPPSVLCQAVTGRHGSSRAQALSTAAAGARTVSVRFARIFS